MPQKKSRRYLAPLVLFTLAGWALWALEAQADPRRRDRTQSRPRLRRRRARPLPARAHATWSKRRLATSLAFATLFFGGAAFSAGAGDIVADAIEGETTTEVTSAEAPVEEPAPAEEGEEPPAEGEDPPAEGRPTAEGGDPPAEGEDPPAEGGPARRGETRPPKAKTRLRR